MFAEFIYQPTSGQYNEKSFDIDTVWKSPNWCWVKFTTDNGQEWVGSFRGKPVKTAIADKINQVAVLTDNCIYILNIDKREIIFHESQTQYRDLIDVPTNDKFLVADYYQIGLIDKEFKFHLLETDYDMDYIKFKNYVGDKLNIEFDKSPDYKRVNGYVDTNKWIIESE
jgi:hypothetical protein